MQLKNWYCPEHGFLCAAPTNAEVRCGATVKRGALTRRCNKRAEYGREIAKRHTRSRRGSQTVGT